MSYECESEYATTYFRCIDPIDNFKIKVILKPVKNPFIPLPQFDADRSPLSEIPLFTNEGQQESEEYTFQWQEKVFSRAELKKYKEAGSKKKIHEKYRRNIPINLTRKKCPSRLFTYVDVDNYTPDIGENIVLGSEKKINKINLTAYLGKKFTNIPKAKIINYYPSKEYKNDNCDLNHKFVQRMYIMIDLDPDNSENQKEELYKVLCTLCYNTFSQLLEITPTFSKSQLNPYVIGINSHDSRNHYYYWLIHASTAISSNSLRKEISLMGKVLKHQEELKKLQIGSEFSVGQPNHLYVSIMGEIIGAEGFEYDHLYVSYYVKLSEGWQCKDLDSLSGVTHTCGQNSNGMVHFSHLFELDIFVELETFEGPTLFSPEIIFEVSSVDKYNRYRNEGYTYTYMPPSPGMYEYELKCWRPSDKKMKSKLERFFIGGGPELDDISYVGLSISQRAELISRFGFETRPTGKINVKLNVLHQSDILKRKDLREEMERRIEADGKSDADTLMSSVNTVLEAFRKAREKMLEARKGLELNGIHELESVFDNKLTTNERKIETFQS